MTAARHTPDRNLKKASPAHALQKTAKRRLKGHVLPCGLPPFTSQKAANRKTPGREPCASERKQLTDNVLHTFKVICRHRAYGHGAKPHLAALASASALIAFSSE